MTETTQHIRVLIVDDQRLIREGLRKLLELESGIEIVDTAGDGEAALVCLEKLHMQQTPPDVILMDIRMPRMDGIAATRAIKTRWPDTHIVILTTFDDTELIYSGLSVGALGYSLKDISSEELAMTVRAAARGQALLQPDIASKVFSALAPPAPTQKNASQAQSTQSQIAYQALPIPSSQQHEELSEHLTEREQEILTLVAGGASNREIAEKLYLTEGTVKNHMSNILSKLGVRDRTQAVIRARTLGLA